MAGRSEPSAVVPSAGPIPLLFRFFFRLELAAHSSITKGEQREKITQIAHRFSADCGRWLAADRTFRNCGRNIAAPKKEEEEEKKRPFPRSDRLCTGFLPGFDGIRLRVYWVLQGAYQSQIVRRRVGGRNWPDSSRQRV